MNDLKFALRQLLKNPGFTAVAVLTLALGLGANTAIFSVVYAVVLRPLPFPDSERLVIIWTRSPFFRDERGPMAAANHRDLLAQNSVFEDIAILREFPPANYNLTGDGDPERLQGARIAANLLPLLRVRPALGRGFTDDETKPGQDGVVLLSHGLWQRRFAGDPGIVGKTIRLDAAPHTVVGVMGPEFQFPSREFQIWTPLTINPADFRTRLGNYHRAVARLKPGVSMAEAQAEIDTVAARLAAEYPDSNKDISFRVAPLRQDISQLARRPLFILLGAVAGLLLIGCANLANLILARGLERARENAVRSALGATRGILVRQSVVEMCPILAIGGLLGVLLGSWGVQMLIPWLPATFPRVEEIRVNIPVLAFTGSALALTSLLVALWPAMHTTRNDVATGLQEDARTASAGVAGNRVREWLVIGQIALTVVLLVGAGLLIRTFTELKSVNPGFRPAGVLSLHLAIPRNRYPSDQEVAALCRRVLEQVRLLPGVESAGMVNRLPLGGITEVWSMEFEGPDAAVIRMDVDGRTATPDYFKTIGIPVLEGRSFTEQDGENTPLLAVVDERIARLLWPKGSALSKRLRVAGATNSWAEIVGVVGHIRHESLGTDERPQVYWNYWQRARDRMAMVVRTAQSPDSLVPSVLAAIRSVDPDQAPYAVRAMSEVLDQSVASRWLNAVLLSLFAGVSLLLASMGLFGVIAWMVNRRTRELGIRLALGAQKRDVLGLVLRQGMKMAGSGIVIGFVGALAVTRVLESLLFGVGPTDPVTFAIIPMLLFAVALIACWLPARRAAKIDPMEALRYE